MAEQLPHGADVVAAFERMGGEGMAKRMQRMPGLAMPAAITAWRIARCTGFSAMWWQRITLERGSTERTPDRNTYCKRPVRA